MTMDDFVDFGKALVRRDQVVAIYQSLVGDQGLVKLNGITCAIETGLTFKEAQARLGMSEPSSIPPGMVFIKGGTFWMGAQNEDQDKPGYDPDCLAREAPVHRVTLSDFWIDRYPVTVAQYQRFMEADWWWRVSKKVSEPREWKEQLSYPSRPITGVNWYEADAYCAWLSATTKRCVRLPTEAQWEYAARGSEGRKYPWGKEKPTDRHLNFASNVGAPTPVWSYPLGATPKEVYDLAGNVWEWCRDWYAEYTADEQIDPSGPYGGDLRVLRGGAFTDVSSSVRCAFRLRGHPQLRYYDIGFRVVMPGSVREGEK